MAQFKRYERDRAKRVKDWRRGRDIPEPRGEMQPTAPTQGIPQPGPVPKRYPNMIEDRIIDEFNGYDGHVLPDIPSPMPERLIPEPEGGPPIPRGEQSPKGIMVLQKNLIEQGYDLGDAGVDGIFGDRTTSAVEEYFG